MTCSNYKTFISLALALACIAISSNSHAELVVRNLDVTISGADYGLDLDQDGNNDFIFVDNGQGDSYISPVANSGASIILDGSIGQPILYSLGDSVEDSQGVRSSGNIILYGGESIISQNAASGAPFNEPGSTGYIGLSLLASSDPPEVRIGWLEITRGSTILGSVGFQTTPNAPAIVEVPEPTSSLLGILAALSATGLLRRV